MFTLILSILIFIIGIAASIFLFTDQEPGKGAASLIGSVLVSVLILILGCVGQVPTGYTGILVSFGRVENTTLDAGLHMTAPWKTIVKMDNRVQKSSVELYAFSSDIQEVKYVYSINYQIDKTNAMNLYSTVGTSYFDTIIAPSVAEAVKTATAAYTAEGLVESRDQLAVDIETILQSALTPYNIKVVSTAVEDIDFSDAFTDAVEAKQVAQQNKLKAQTEAEQRVIEATAQADIQKVTAEAEAEARKINAEAEAEIKKISADAEAYAISAKAEAEAVANEKISKSLTAELIDYAKANNWDGKLPSYIGGNAAALINMPTE